MFEQLWEESPMIQKMRAQYYEKGEAKGFEKGREEGREEGAVQTLQKMLVKDVQRRFPRLVELTQKKVKLCKKSEVLEQIYQQVQDAPDFETVQQVLGSILE